MDKIERRAFMKGAGLGALAFTVGGAEILLLNLFKHFDPKVVEPRLVCLRNAGPLADDFRAALD